MFHKVDGFIRDQDGTKYLILIGPEKQDAIFSRIRYLIGLKNGITDVDSYSSAKIKINSDDDLPLEKMLTMHNVVRPLKSIFNENRSQYYYKMFLEKCSYKLAKKIKTKNILIV